MLVLTRITAPAATPVPLAVAKAHLRVDHDDDDELIESLIATATELLDGWNGILGRALVTQTWRADIERFPLCRYLKLPLPPIQSVTSIKYFDTANAEQTFAGAGYSLLNGAVVLANGVSFPAAYDRGDAVRITFVAGWPMTEGDEPQWTGPAPIRHAILLLIGHWYGLREAVSVSQVKPEAIPLGVDALLSPYRVFA